MSYSDAIRFLYELHWFGARPGLENTLKLAEQAGNPQDRLRFIHVTGTNGKGSTCAILESIYRAAGLKVGLFTSPHLVSFRERIQVNRRLIGETDVTRLVAELQPGLAAFPADHHPTFFEIVTVMALRYFAEQRCDLVIWETGLGGRLDATNIVTPLASVITNVQHDHEKWLGNTLPEIAFEKAGIIKPGVPVLTAATGADVLKVIRDTARARRAPLTVVEEPTDESSELPLLGDHQRLNAALALATVETLQRTIPVKPEAVQAGLRDVSWPGRLQLVTRESGRKVLLDCAHNLDAAEILAAGLKKCFPSVRPTLVLGILRDKDWEHMCGVLAPLAARLLAVPVSSERTTTAEELVAVCRRIAPQTEIKPCASLESAMKEAATDPFVVVTGSIYLVGEAMVLLGLSSEAGGSERALNEWGGTPQAATAGRS